MNLARTLRPLSAAALLLALTACGTSGGSNPGEGASAVSSQTSRGAASSTAPSAAEQGTTASSGSTTPSAVPEPRETTAGETAASPSSAPSGGASDGAAGGQAVALTQTFTTPDGTISFRYPADWSVTELATSTEQIPAWGLDDENGVRMFTLSIRPDGQIASPVTPQNPATVGTLPNALDAQGHPLAIAVGPFPGQAPGVNMANVYAVTSTSAADQIFGYVGRGDGTMVSFEGTQEGGINNQVDMADETQKFMAGDLFRTRLLPVLQSFTMKPVAG